MISSFISKAYAQTLTIEDFGSSSTRFGAFYNFYNIFVWAFNICVYLGGLFAGIGIVWTFATMASKFIGEPDTDTFQIVRGGFSKALMFGFIGVLLLGVGSLFKLIGDALGTPIEFVLPTELNFIVWN